MLKYSLSTGFGVRSRSAPLLAGPAWATDPDAALAALKTTVMSRTERRKAGPASTRGP